MTRTDADHDALDIAAAVIVDGDRVLITRRPDHAVLAGYWEFPGGKCRPNESLEACLRREVHEEVGATIAIGELLERVVHRYPHGVVDISFFGATLESGSPHTRGCAEVRWVPLAELSAYRFPEANAALVTRLSNGSLGRPREAHKAGTVVQ